MAFNNIGALWKKEGQKGTFLSGTIEINGEKHKILVFKNDRKKMDKHPDYQIVQASDEPRSPQSPPATQVQQFTPPAPPVIQQQQDTSEVNTSDIPF